MPSLPATTIIPPWSSWESLAVNLSNVPVEADTFAIWQAFKGEGWIFSIDLYEDARGNRETKGKIRFRFVPPFHLYFTLPSVCLS